MPIHFRCQSCDRMLSIATRKAGTSVGCPKCGKQVMVPAAAGVAVASDPVAANKLEAMPLFERSDFEQLLAPAAKAAEKSPAAAKEKSEPHPVILPEAVSIEDSAGIDVLAMDGIVISRSRMTWLAVAVAVLLMFAFAIGYFLAAATVSRTPAVTSQVSPRGFDG